MTKKQIYAVLKELDKRKLLTCSPLSILKDQGEVIFQAVKTATIQVKCSYCSNTPDECVGWEACKDAPYIEDKSDVFSEEYAALGHDERDSGLFD